MTKNHVRLFFQVWFVVALIALTFLIQTVGPSAAAVAPVGIIGRVNSSTIPSGALRFVGASIPPGYSPDFQPEKPLTVCRPDDGPIELEGTVDVGAIPAGTAVAYVGLLDKGFMAAGETGKLGGAYFTVTRDAQNEVTFGLSDGSLNGGSILNTIGPLAMSYNKQFIVNFFVDGTKDPTTCNGVAGDVGCMSLMIRERPQNDPIINWGTITAGYGHIKTLDNNAPYSHDEFALGAHPGWDDSGDADMPYKITIKGCEPDPVHISVSAPSASICDGSVDMTIHFSNVPYLAGLQIVVNYDDTLVNASGTFIKTWFNGGFQPGGWNGDCVAGRCQFASVQIAPLPPATGGGDVAKVTFTPKNPPATGETFTAFLSEVQLSTPNGIAIAYDLTDADLEFSTCVADGTATVSGQVALQGRATPLDPGWVTFSDDGGIYPDVTVPFNATGIFTATLSVKGDGSDYTMQAFHDLYLANEKSLSLVPGDTLANQNTRLLGGDANNSGVYAPFAIGVTLDDITCIANDFDEIPSQCGASLTGSSDINQDGAVSIQDLTISGGNFGLNPFLGW